MTWGPGSLSGLIVAGLCTHSLAAPTCTVATSATLSFGVVIALASSADVTSNTGSSFWINCTSDVLAAPLLYSGTPRALVSNGHSLAFGLSTVAPGGPELPTTSPGTALGVPHNGNNQTVTLHGRLESRHFKSLPAGAYARSVALTVEY